MPQPIDLQTEMARVIATERIQQIADRASLVAQQRMAAYEQDARVDVETAVHEPQPKSEEVEAEARRRNPYMGRRRRRRASQSEDEKEREAAHKFYTADEHEETVENPDEHHFDVTV